MDPRAWERRGTRLVVIATRSNSPSMKIFSKIEWMLISLTPSAAGTCPPTRASHHELLLEVEVKNGSTDCAGRGLTSSSKQDQKGRSSKCQMCSHQLQLS